MNQEIKISRSDLIVKCDQYLNGEIEEKDFENYAWNLKTEEHFNLEDDVISDIIYQWDSPEINFPITKQNIRLNFDYDEIIYKDLNQNSQLEKAPKGGSGGGESCAHPVNFPKNVTCYY